ncbi:MAG: OmpA family protein [Gemmatimonadota bacterium]
MRALTRAVPYVIVVVLALTNLSACASKKSYDASVARGDSLQVANVQLQADYDSLQNIFATEMEAASLDMQLLRDGIEIELPADLLFESGSLTVKRSASEFGMKLVDYLKGNDYLVFVTGYTDSQNPIGNLAQRYPTNWELSAARAALAVRFLVGEGLSGSRFWATGRAANDPVASNSTPEGRTKNRRLRLVLRPAGVVYSTP